MKKKAEKYYLVINSKNKRVQGAFLLNEEGRASAEKYIRFLEKKHEEKGIFDLVKK